MLLYLEKITVRWLVHKNFTHSQCFSRVLLKKMKLERFW